jgi:hypothetical protein
MALYTINLISHHGAVRDADELDCDTDEEAVAFAEDMNVPAFGNGYDVWQQERLVCRHRERDSRAWPSDLRNPHDAMSRALPKSP